MLYLKAYLGSLFAFLLLDAIWLGVITRSYYPRQIGHLMAERANFVAAAVFYAIYIGGVVFLAVRPAMATNSISSASVYGAVLGLIAYGTFGFTNLSVLRDWPLPMTLVDTTWGIALTATAAAAGLAATRVG